MFFSKRILGIDVGTYSVRLVEISGRGEGTSLENYGEMVWPKQEKKPGQPEIASPSNATIANAIRAIAKEAGIKTKTVVFSIPDFSTFSTSFDLPPMPQKEIPGAIHYNASQYITLAAEEVTLDWKILPGAGADQSSKVFLVAVPNQVIEDYKSIAKLAGLELHAVEAEAMALARVFAKQNSGPICFIDVGMQSSTVNLAEKGFLKKSFSVSVTSAMLESEIMQSAAEPLVSLAQQAISEFTQQEHKEIGLVYLTGGAARAKGLQEYLSSVLKKPVTVPNSFAGLSYHPALSATIQEMAPRFSVAVGVALGGFST